MARQTSKHAKKNRLLGQICEISWIQCKLVSHHFHSNIISYVKSDEKFCCPISFWTILDHFTVPLTIWRRTFAISPELPNLYRVNIKSCVNLNWLWWQWSHHQVGLSRKINRLSIWKQMRWELKMVQKEATSKCIEPTLKSGMVFVFFMGKDVEVLDLTQYMIHFNVTQNAGKQQ